VRLGRTLAGGDRQTYVRRDLDGDGVPDFVVAHRRKVWVFHGGPEGPQFTHPTTVLKVADDVTAMLLLDLDRDGFPDLMLLRIQVPTAATLLRGLVAEWSVEVAALGYRSLGGRDFERTPRWKGEIDVRLPALVGVLKNPEALLSRFEDVTRRFDGVVEGDLDGDGRPDVALLAPDGGSLDVWLSSGGRGAGPGRGDDPDEALARVFFGPQGEAWDLDRILAWLGGVAERRVAGLTGDRPPDRRVVLAARPGAGPPAVYAADVDGDGADDLVVVTDLGDGLAVEVHRVR
jgi:hypothetical protein